MAFYGASEACEVLRMIQVEKLDIRAVTLGISLLDCVSDSLGGKRCLNCLQRPQSWNWMKDENGLTDKICEKVQYYAGELVEKANKVSSVYGIPIRNKRIAVTPISAVAGKRSLEEFAAIAQVLDCAIKKQAQWEKEQWVDGITFVGGFSALVHKGWTETEQDFLSSIPLAIGRTERVCSSVNVATTKAGINMTAVRRMGQIIKELARETAEQDAVGCAKLVIFANAPEDNPFMAGAFHGIGEPECALNIGISGPGVVRRIVEDSRDVDFSILADRIKRTVFKVVRAGELIGSKLAAHMCVPFGIVDLSLAPVPSDEEKDPELTESVAAIVEAMGLERCGTHGTLAALALLIDAVKRGGAMASSRVGGLSGTFIPVSEDSGMVRAVRAGALTLDKLEAMTGVCSVGLDMIAIPGDTSAETIAAIIADEMAIGVVNDKTTAVRIIPVPNRKPGDYVDWRKTNPLLGQAQIMHLHSDFSSARFINRNSPFPGSIPAPATSLRN